MKRIDFLKTIPLLGVIPSLKIESEPPKKETVNEEVNNNLEDYFCDNTGYYNYRPQYFGFHDNVLPHPVGVKSYVIEGEHKQRTFCVSSYKLRTSFDCSQYKHLHELPDSLRKNIISEIKNEILNMNPSGIYMVHEFVSFIDLEFTPHRSFIVRLAK